MRYDKKIYFVSEGEMEYDDATGNYIPSVPSKNEVWANISDTGTRQTGLIYGGLKQGALTVRIRGKYGKKFDCIEIGDKEYNVDRVRTFRNDQAFNLSEQK